MTVQVPAWPCVGHVRHVVCCRTVGHTRVCCGRQCCASATCVKLSVLLTRHATSPTDRRWHQQHRDARTCRPCSAVYMSIDSLRLLQQDAATTRCATVQVPGVHDPLDPEYSILKQRLARRARYEKVRVCCAPDVCYPAAFSVTQRVALTPPLATPLAQQLQPAKCQVLWPAQSMPVVDICLILLAYHSALQVLASMPPVRVAAHPVPSSPSSTNTPSSVCSAPTPVRTRHLAPRPQVDVQKLDLVTITKLAERTISNDLEFLIDKAVDVKRANYAVVTGAWRVQWGSCDSGSLGVSCVVV